MGATKASRQPTIGELENRLCAFFTRFHKAMVGKGCSETRCRLSDGFLLVEQHGVLTKEEQNMLRFDSKGRLIQHIRRSLYEVFRGEWDPELSRMVGQPVQFLGYEIRPDADTVRIRYRVRL